MSKIIVHNRSSASDKEVLQTVSMIIGEGRVSNDGKQYCYLVSLMINGIDTHFVSDVNKSSDRFTVYDASVLAA